MAGLIDRLPRPLLTEILAGQWLPVIGSGLSRNAAVPYGPPPPDWSGLADVLRADLADPDDNADAVEVISAYAFEHGRVSLVERVGAAIRVGDSRPAPVHLSLCRLPIDSLATTNFDFLLEKAFDQVGKPCNPIVDEHQLSIRNPYPGPLLYKIHGDVQRPDRMVLTEADFDAYLLRNPLYATVLTAELARKSPVLIGYSLSDPDLRQLLAMVRERTGDGTRMIYSLEVDPPRSKVDRFARRHVAVVALPGDRRDPAPTLQALFDELFAAIPNEAAARLFPRTHEGGMVLARGAGGRTCFVSAPLESLPDYEEWLTPAAADEGIALVRAEDFIAPGEALMAKLDAIISSVGCAVVEAGSDWTLLELGMVLNRLGPDSTLVVVAPHSPIPSDLAGIHTLPRPGSDDEWGLTVDRIVAWMVQVLGPKEAPSDDAYRVEGEIISISADLEGLLSTILGEKRSSLSHLVSIASKAGVLTSGQHSTLRRFAQIRNAIAHGRATNQTPGQLRRAINGARRVLESLASDFNAGDFPRD
jgi:hypothetical protein